MLYVFSVGLNVLDAESSAQLAYTLSLAAAMFGSGIRAVAMGEGEWEGERERFIQIAAETDSPEVDARTIARAFSQAAVAVIGVAAREKWALVYADGRTEPGFDTAAAPIIVTL